MTVPAGVRGAGMGGMFTAVADDVSTTYWNMAGLSQLNKIEVNFLHVSYFSGTNYEFAGAAFPIQSGSTIGLSLSFDSVPSFNSTNNPAAVPGSANDFAIALGYGQAFGDNFSVGIGGKYISSNLVSYSASGEALDAGLLLYTKSRDLTLGLSVQNVGEISSFSQYSTSENLPLTYRAGLVYRFQPEKPTRFLLGIDLDKPIDSDPVIDMGGEVWLGDNEFAVAFRGGYSFNSLNQDLGGATGASLGAGIRLTGFELDYALVPFGVLGDTQRFSISYRFDKDENKTKTQEPNVSAVEIKPQIADYQTGTLKQATFDLKPQARTDIKNWTLDITDKGGNVIRSYTGKGVPPRQISWDGKDVNGNVVTGGIFANYNFRTVDVRGEQVVSTESIFKVSQVSAREVPLMASVVQEPQVFKAPSLSEALERSTPSNVIKVPAVSFHESTDRLNGAYYDYLDEVARYIRKHPNSKVYIEGHAYDEGNEKEELLLSQNRADSVMRYLVEKGNVSPDNLYSRGHGESAPLDRSGTEAARFKNRRVDIIILTNK